MPDEIINLETQKPISMLKSLGIGICAFFKNIVPFFKMSLPVWLNYIGVLFLFAPVALLKSGVNFITLFISTFIFIIGLILFLYSFWKYMLGIVAVSYLAKDIYENKPLQKPSKYYNYVIKNQKSYLIYLLWACLYGIIFILLFALLAFVLVALAAKLSLFIIIILVSLIVAVLFYLLLTAIQFSVFYWAYGDKNKKKEHINSAIKTVLENCFSFVALGFVLFVITFLFLVIITVFNYILMHSSAIVDFISYPLGLLINLFLSFVCTRYYFALASKTKR